MSVKQYRKKPVVIKAIAYEGTAVSATAIIGWADDYGTTITLHCLSGEGCRNQDHALRIQTFEGHMFASPGDFIIKGMQDEFYPCRGDIFEMTYEAVEAGE